MRNYQSDPIEDTVVHEIIKAGQFAPTANNNRAVEFIVVQDPETKEKIYQVAEPHQDFVKAAPILIIPISDTTKTNLPIPDLSLASQNMFLQATALGLWTVWKNFYPPVAEKVKDILHIPDRYHLVNAIVLGKPKKMPSPYTDAAFDPTKIHTGFYNRE